MTQRERHRRQRERQIETVGQRGNDIEGNRREETEERTLRETEGKRHSEESKREDNMTLIFTAEMLTCRDKRYSEVPRICPLILFQFLKVGFLFLKGHFSQKMGEDFRYSRNISEVFVHKKRKLFFKHFSKNSNP